MMKNLDEYLGKARVIPFFRGGEPYGFRVSNLGSDAQAYQFGMRAGDIIRSINGVPVRTPEDAFKAYEQFQNESNVQLEVERGKDTVTVSIPVKK
jgi:general secretion pathway protein C